MKRVASELVQAIDDRQLWFVELTNRADQNRSACALDSVWTFERHIPAVGRVIPRSARERSRKLHVLGDAVFAADATHVLV